MATKTLKAKTSTSSEKTAPAYPAAGSLPAASFVTGTGGELHQVAAEG